MTSKNDGKQTAVSFLINGKQFNVSGDVPINTSLNTFIREYANQKGTKNMCHEGGCGACVVSVTSMDTVTKKEKTYGVNSCLVPIFSCHGWEITTIEGVGNKLKGYHMIQKRLTELSGTQCGYCTPGMVMNMYALSHDKKVTMEEVENSFGGNICRCTGYRPILDAFKSLAVDATQELKDKCLDIEDLGKATKICPNSGKECEGKCKLRDLDLQSPVHVELGCSEWFRVSTIDQLFDTLKNIEGKSYRLVAGNTAQGVYRLASEPDVYIDVAGVEELVKSSVGKEVVLGGNMSLTQIMELFYSISKSSKPFAYTKVLADHIDLIANVPVRNIGTLAGNLSIKHEYREFPSDMFLMLETVGATIVLMGADKKKSAPVSLRAYLDENMKTRIIHSIILPPYSEDYFVKTYKIMPRAQNAHAYVNAGFLFKLGKDKKGVVLEVPNIVFGGIEPDFVHASKTENFLAGKDLFDTEILKKALKSLENELQPNHVLPDASVSYRKGLAESLFYKFVLSLLPDKLPKTLVSGGQDFKRPVSSGKQEYDTDKSIWPLNQPVPKLEGLIQCSGEAQYVNDIHALPGELHGAFVLTKVAQGTIKKIDASEALKITGVVAFFEAKDIPGTNNFVAPLLGLDTSEEIFCSGEITHAGQTVGLIVATSHQLANKAAKVVKVEVEARQGVYLMSDVIKKDDQSRIVVQKKKEATKTDVRKNATHVIEGNFSIGSQYHYTMETQSCVCVPNEDGMDVYPATQWMDLAQIAISNALKLPENRINVKVRRLGGAYGAKISRSSLVATACAIAAHHLNKPVRIVMAMETNMEACGKRYDCSLKYKVGVDDDGRVMYLDSEFYQNSGWNYNETVLPFSVEHMTNCYEDDTWTVTGKAVRTDIASNTYCRAPGSTEGVALIENVMEHIARAVKKDPIQVRLNNLDPKDTVIKTLIEEHMKDTSFSDRKTSVEEYNKANRWRKRGIALVPMRYPFGFWGNFHALVSIYAQDGTVSVVHGGIEMGQGINTKVAQVTAHILGVPLEYVSVKPSNNLTAPNGMVSGGSVTSETCTYAAMQCCKQLLERLAPVKAGMKDPTWPQLTKAAYQQNVDLCATHMFTNKDDVKNYAIWGVTVAEVEVDLLTGQPQILRVDILEDAGQSMSPEVDVGQIEGSFVMGIGYWLTEDIVYQPDSGELLTNRTWNYKPPGPKDIPIDFRVLLRRNAPNPAGVLRAKATGEPPLCMSVAVLLAVRNAVESARKDSGDADDWFELNAPATTEKIFLASLTNFKQFSL